MSTPDGTTEPDTSRGTAHGGAAGGGDGAGTGAAGAGDTAAGGAAGGPGGTGPHHGAPPGRAAAGSTRPPGAPAAADDGLGIVLPAGRFRLRPHLPADADRVVEQCTDPETVRWTTVPAPYRRADAEEFIAGNRRHWAAPGRRERVDFAIAEAATDRFVGTIDLGIDGAAGSVGYGLHPDARGSGAAQAAVQALAAWAFRPESGGGLGLELLRWQAFRGNFASRRVVWRAGFRVEGTVRSYLSQRGTLRDAWVGTLHRDDPRAPLHPWNEVPQGLADPRCVLRAWRPDSEDDVAAVLETWREPAAHRGPSDPSGPFAPSGPSDSSKPSDPPDSPGPSDPSGPPHHPTHEAARAFLLTALEANASGAAWYAAVADPADASRCLGLVALAGREDAELTCWVRPGARGRGVATAAVRLALRHGFAPAERGGLALRRVAMSTVAGDEASRRLAARTGFTRTAMQRAAALAADGTPVDLVLHDLLSTEYAARADG